MKLDIVGECGLASRKLCGECEGDCDSDRDCKEGKVHPNYTFLHVLKSYFNDHETIIFILQLISGLKCFHREDLEDIKGCSGRGRMAKDYCYKPALELEEEPDVTMSVFSPNSRYIPGKS